MVIPYGNVSGLADPAVNVRSTVDELGDRADERNRLDPMSTMGMVRLVAAAGSRLRLCPHAGGKLAARQEDCQA